MENNPKTKAERLKESNGEVLISLIKEKCELFSNLEGKNYAKFSVGNHKEVYSLDSQEFTDALSHWYYKKTNRGVSKSVLETVMSTLNAIARHDGKNMPVYLRTAQLEGAIYIDLCDKDWRCVEVTRDGICVLDESPILFTRTNNMKPLPIPSNSINYDDAKDNIRLLLKHINIQENQLVLVVGWILMSLQSSKAAYPILVVNGSAGSGKSTACEMLRSLIDPNKANLISQPKSSELRVVAAENHVLAFDNISNISPNFSDSICKISTGDNQIIRKLYTTNSSMTLSMKKVLILNGIPEMTKRADLVSRSVKISLKKIENRMTLENAWKAFNDDSKDIFESLLVGLSVALMSYDNIKVKDMTRMADFCRFATASHIAYGWSESNFMEIYNENIKSSHVDSLESSLFSSGIVKMFERELNFEGRPIELLEHLEDKQYVSEKTIRSSKWVSTPKGVIENLDRAEDSLEAIGITYQKYKDRNNKTYVKLWTESNLSNNYKGPEFEELF